MGKQQVNELVAGVTLGFDVKGSDAQKTELELKPLSLKSAREAEQREVLIQRAISVI